MFFRRSTCLLLSAALSFQSIAPTLAMQQLEDLEQRTDLREYSSVPTNLSLKAQSGRTAAGSFLYALHEGKIRFLLGQRKESGHWCNPGGGSEESNGREVFLFHTAARETNEELNGLYCPQPRLLKNKPYIDTDNGSLFYRMYWEQVQYLDEEILINKLQGATAVGQEFTDFIWLEAPCLLQAVEDKQPIIQINPEKNIEIYPELFSMLSTLSGKAFLKSLINHKKIHRFSKDLRLLINRLYFIGQEAPLLTDLKSQPPRSWPTINVDPEAQAIAAQEQAMKNLYLSPLSLCSATEEGKLEYLDKRATFLKKKDSLAEAVFPPNPYQIVVLDKEGDKSILAGAVAAHLGSLIELKHHFSQKNAVANDQTKREASYSDMSLRIILGPDYKTPDHFPNTENPQDSADNENIKVFLDRYYRADEIREGKREVKVLPSDHSLIKTILQWERHKASPTFYNATSDTIYSLSLFFSHLRKYMMAAPLEGLPGFRGTDIYFKGIKTMVDAIEKYGYRDYTPGESNGRSNLVLCGNATALAGLSTTCTTSSSIEYVMNNHSVRPPDLGSVIQEALALSGFDDPTNTYFEALFQQFIAHNHPEYANSVMFAIQLHPELLETYTYPAYGGGSPFTQKDEYTIQLLSTNPALDSLNGMGPKDIALYSKEAGLFCKVLDQEEMEIPQEGTDITLEVFDRLKKAVQTNTSLQSKDKKALLDFTLSKKYTQSEEKGLTTPQIFEGLEAEYNKQKQFPEPFEQDRERKKALISEIRILPHPEIAFDSEKFLVTPFPRFPIPNEQVCKHQMDLISMAMIADWLENENCILDGAFHQYPVAKRLYNAVHLGVSGNPVKEKLSFEGLFNLVQHGHVEAVKGYIETYPSILENASKDRLILAALKSNVPEMLKLVLIDLKDDLQIKVSEEEMTKFLRIAKDSKWDRSTAFILNHMQQNQLDFAKTCLPVLYQLLQPELKFGFPGPNDLEKRITLLGLCVASPHPQDWFKDLIIDHLLTTSLFQVINEACSEILFPHKIISPLDVVIKVHKKLSSPEIWGQMAEFGLSYQQVFINFLKQSDDQDLLLQKGLSGDPFIFDLVEWGNPLCKDLVTYLKTKPYIFDLRNQEGLGLLAAFQKARLEGHPAKPLSSFLTLYKQAGLDIPKESYRPFLQLYGIDYKEQDALYANHASLLNQSQNRQWALHLANAMPPQDLSKLLATCPDERLWKAFHYKINSFQLSKIVQKRMEAHSAYNWANQLMKTLHRMQQNEDEVSLDNKWRNPFDLVDEDSSGLPNDVMGFFRSMKVLNNVMNDQFPDRYSFSDRDSKEPKSLSDILSRIPESISSGKDILEKLKHSYYYQDLDIYFQSLPEFTEISLFLENREKSLSAKRIQWLNLLKELVETKNEPEIYHHVESMPYLVNSEYSQMDKLLEPYCDPMEMCTGLNVFEKEYQEEKWIKYAENIPSLIQKGRVSPEQIEKLIRTISAAALRKSLHIFLKDNTAVYLPMVLSSAYGCAADFAKENLFYQKLNDNIYGSLPGIYYHPFPYALMGGNDPVLMVKNLHPYLDAQNAPDLLRSFDTSHLWKLVKTSKPKDVETLVMLMPWMFQWHEKDKDFFLFSIQNLPKSALKHLVMESLDILKITEMSRCLPYFVHLMMDGGNAAIINQTLHQEPSLLKIQSFDGLGMDDFLTFYASPIVVKVIHDFQKKSEEVGKNHQEGLNFSPLRETSTM